jgi:hypothetical protein
MKSTPYLEMKPSELAEATKQFDEPFVAEQSRPSTPAEKEQWLRVRRKSAQTKVARLTSEPARSSTTVNDQIWGKRIAAVIFLLGIAFAVASWFGWIGSIPVNTVF